MEKPVLLKYLQNLRGRCQPSEKIWPASSRLFLKRFRLLAKQVTGKDNLTLPSSLRANGTTYFFVRSQGDVFRTMWQGRWANYRMLHHYVQELQSVNVMAQLDQHHASRVQAWTEIWRPLLQHLGIEGAPPARPM